MTTLMQQPHVRRARLAHTAAVARLCAYRAILVTRILTVTLQLPARHVARGNTRALALPHALTARPVVGTRTQTQPPTANSAQMVGIP
eukprot:COSAG06_NODE_40363_length_402_cov_1.528053_1_plen_87_part_01